jgi:hypothetical protein
MPRPFPGTLGVEDVTGIGKVSDTGSGRKRLRRFSNLSNNRLLLSIRMWVS